MKTSSVLKATSIVSFLFAIGHSLGGSSSWSPVGDSPTLQAMRAFHMQVFGVSRSYHDFFMGFGYSLSVYMVLEAVLLWLLAGLARAHAKATRPFIAAFLVAALINTVLTFVYIFPLPAAFAVVQTALLALALQRSGKEMPSAQAAAA